jgi:hypothetical protein
MAARRAARAAPIGIWQRQQRRRWAQGKPDRGRRGHARADGTPNAWSGCRSQPNPAARWGAASAPTAAYCGSAGEGGAAATADAAGAAQMAMTLKEGLDARVAAGGRGEAASTNFPAELATATQPRKAESRYKT